MGSLQLSFVPVVAVIALGLGASPGLTFGQESTQASDRDAIIHVLNRITFGPRPGDVEMVQKMGLHNYIESQLHPETIDDSAVEQQIAQFDMLQMTSPQLMALYLEERKRAKEKRDEKMAEIKAQEAAAKGAPAPAADGTAAPAPMPPGMQPAMQEEAAVPPPPPPPSFDGKKSGAKIQGLAALADQIRSVAAIGQMEQAKLVRAVESQRQLQEVLVDFWGNHFNIDMKKNLCRILKVADDRDVIRPHIWGKFRDLLEASAKSPAMLAYLDNATNSVARNVSPMQQQMIIRLQEKAGLDTPEQAAAEEADATKPKKRGGINENYAREIMELHTLGVDAGYTQQDVQEVARCFTGWTINRQTGEYRFAPAQHDNGVKQVLGHVIPANGGEKDGEMVLDILVSQPACAHFIAKEMCQRFVADDPPAALVDRVAGVFTQTGGDLRQVTEAILTSPEFMSPSTYGNKVKSPLEFAVSAVRASQSTMIAQEPPPLNRIRQARESAGVLGKSQAADQLSNQKRQSLNWHIYELGEPLFACTPPTGYKEVSKTWVSPGALIERLNFAMALTEQRVSDIQFNAQTILGGTDLDKPEALLNQCVSVLLQNNVTDATKKVLEQTALPAPGESKTVQPNKLIALVIGSPEFQRK